MTDQVEIKWLDGTGFEELSPREQQLVARARDEGYAAGERHGYRMGGADALRAATEFTTLISDRRWLRAIETLRYFAGLAEDEVGSRLWRSGE